MSLSLGEKLRQAREERGLSVTEVSEQTRISPLYLESIENDDYKSLPGGIFNKGFVKSYAKFVGINEQEALEDYSQLVSAGTTEKEGELKTYRPQVLTDDRSSASTLPTVIVAVIILGLMTGGILFLLNYIRKPQQASVVEPRPTATVSADAVNASTPVPAAAELPKMGAVKIEFKTTTEPVSLTATNDGKTTSNTVAAGTTTLFEPSDSLKLSYSKSLAQTVRLAINGKTIALPAQPLMPKRNSIEVEINGGNVGQIWSQGAVSTDVPAASTAEVEGAPVATGQPTPGAPIVPAAPRPTPVVKANTAVNAAAKPTPAAKPSIKPTPAVKPPVKPANTE